MGNFTGVLERFYRIRWEDLATAGAVTRFEYLLANGVPSLHLGRYAEAWRHLGSAKNLSDTEVSLHDHVIGGASSRLVVRNYLARTRVYQGYLDEAMDLVTGMVAIAEESGHAPTTAWAGCSAAQFSLLRGDLAAAERQSRTVIDISERFGISTRLCLGMMYLGQVYIAMGKTEEGIAHARKGYKMWATVGGMFHCSEHAARIADGLLVAGCVNEAAEFVGLGEQVQRDSEERFCEAELIRLRGRLLELDKDLSGAEDSYRRALAVAEGQGAKLFSLRAAVDLARLTNAQGRRAEARASLEPIYEWFTEGFDFPDLIRAKATLETLC